MDGAFAGRRHPLPCQPSLHVKARLPRTPVVTYDPAIMRVHVSHAIVLCALVVLTSSAVSRGDSRRDALIKCRRELQQRRNQAEELRSRVIRDLKSDPTRTRNALRLLEVWNNEWGIRSFAVSQTVPVKNSKPLEAVLFQYPASDWPNSDLAVVFLLSNDRVIDWKANWSSRRTAVLSQEPVIQDIDGDGFPDVGFRIGSASDSPRDVQQPQAFDKQAWRRAFAITPSGFRSLLADDDHRHRLKVAYDLSGQPVRLHLDGVPSEIGDNDNFVCTVSVTNTSTRELRIDSDPWAGAGWAYFDSDPRAGLGTCEPNLSKKSVLRPGETVTYDVDVHLRPPGDAATLICKFGPRLP